MADLLKRARVALVLALAGLATVAVPASRADTPWTHYTGTLPDGATWIADVPNHWNGTLLLYSHGYGTLLPADAPDYPPPPGGQSPTHDALLREGYALAGSSYDPTGSLWALGSALRDQFGTLGAVKEHVLPGPPSQVIAFGTSMGGLISSLEDQHSNGRIDAALTTCGIVAGGIQLNNYQLDGEYAIRQLLLGTPLKLVRFSSMGEAAATGAALEAAATNAQQTPQGRARLALAMALLNVGTWAPGETPPGPHDYAQQEQEQFDLDFAPTAPIPYMLFVETGRYEIEQAAGGSGAWTVGVNFAQQLARSSYLPEVRALYRAAGLDLGRDLAALNAGADIRADARAIRWLQETSVPTSLQVPELDMHTISDQLVPVQQERYYRSVIARAGDRALLRQAFVNRVNHCNFTTAELVAGVHAVQYRLHNGDWNGITRPAALEALARSLHLGDAAFIPYEPAELTGNNGPFTLGVAAP